MSNLRRKINSFFTQNRNRGIARLMLWICIGNALVYAFSLFNEALPELLRFSAQDILSGQVWRLFSYIFTFASDSSFFGSSLFGAVISIMFYYWAGNTLEDVCGTLRFNLYYLVGILINDAVGLLIYWLYPINIMFSSGALNLSMYLAVATLLPEARVYVYGIVPVKMKWMAWVYLGLTAYDLGSNFSSTIPFLMQYGSILSGGYIASLLLYCLFPLVSLLNYFLFFGGSLRNLTPHFKRINIQRQSRADARKKTQSSGSGRAYRHRCTVCGRTDADCPGLEFRYCSRCRGYFCYCIDHINNHTHVE